MDSEAAEVVGTFLLPINFGVAESNDIVHDVLVSERYVFFGWVIAEVHINAFLAVHVKNLAVLHVKAATVHFSQSASQIHFPFGREILEPHENCIHIACLPVL